MQRLSSLIHVPVRFAVSLAVGICLTVIILALKNWTLDESVCIGVLSSIVGYLVSSKVIKELNEVY